MHSRGKGGMSKMMLKLSPGMRLLIDPFNAIVFFVAFFFLRFSFFPNYPDGGRARELKIQNTTDSLRAQFAQVSAGNLQFIWNAFRLITSHCSG